VPGWSPHASLLDRIGTALTPATPATTSALGRHITGGQRAGLVGGDQRDPGEYLDGLHLLDQHLLFSEPQDRSAS
jgi:hypothetical protein